MTETSPTTDKTEEPASFHQGNPSTSTAVVTSTSDAPEKGQDDEGDSDDNDDEGEEEEEKAPFELLGEVRCCYQGSLIVEESYKSNFPR